MGIAQDLLQRFGVAGFSFQDLADRLKIKKASIHYHFATKEDLLMALIEEYEKSFLEWIPKVAGKTPEQKLQAYFKIFRSFAVDSYKLCPAGALTFQVPQLSALLRKRLTSFYRIHGAWLMETLKAAQETGFLRKDMKPEEMISLISVSVQGAMHSCRLYESVTPYDRSIETLLKCLQSSGRSRGSNQR